MKIPNNGWNAVEEYYKVISEDENYDVAQEKLESLKPRYKAEIIKQLEEFKIAKNFDSGTSLVNKAIEILGYQDDLNDYKKIFFEQKQELEKMEAEKAEQSRIAALKNTIRVTRVSVSAPDSASGVALYFNFKNTSNKTMKYVNFGVQFYNAVGDVVTCEIKRASVNYCEATGPFAPGGGLSGTSYYWGKYYNSTIKSAKLVSLSIEFTDGTKQNFDAGDLQYVQY